MELKVLLCGEHVMTLEPGLGHALQEDRMEWRPGAEKLSITWNGRRSAEDVRQWLEHLLPEGEESTVFRERAEMALREHGSPTAKAPDTIARIWGNADREYAGAVGFVAVGGDGREVRWPAHGNDDRCSPSTIARELRLAQHRAEQGTRFLSPETWGGRTSLSGMRGKIALHWDERGQRWRHAAPNRLSTHIIKAEDYERNPGEACIESIVQRTLRKAGLRAAETYAAVYEGVQAVVSKREDRRMKEGVVTAIHQEDWAQASGVGRSEKYHYQREDPSLQALCGLMEKYGRPGSVREAVEVVVAGAMLGHIDMHRKNLGLRHEGRGVELAPVYDASSASGRGEEYTRKLALPVGNADHPDALQAEDVEWLVQGTAMSAEEARAVARRTVEALPDALADAVAEAKQEDGISERHGAAGEARKRALQEETRARCGRMAMMLRAARGPGRRSGRRGTRERCSAIS